MNLKIYRATLEDLLEIVRMLSDDFLGATLERYENPLPESYVKAFEEIEADNNIELVVAVMSEVDPPQAGESNNSLINATDYQVAAVCGTREAASDEIVVGTLQIRFTPSISFQGGKRAGVESVRVDAKYRGQGIGKELMLWAINRAKEEKCVAMQLTTNASRTGARRFYENLGFKGTHLGMKLYLK